MKMIERSRPSFYRAITAIIAASVIAGCGGMVDKPVNAVASSGADAGAPVALAPKRTVSSSVAMPVNADDVTKAVERLRITKKKSESVFDQAGADLNSDGRAEALVLLTGADWCSPQGCTLAVFQAGETGFRPISQIVGVKEPVAVAATSNAGWRDLIVKTGTGKVVRLAFSNNGYPANASAQPDASNDLTQSEILIQGQSAAQTVAVGASPASQ